ncbi:MAG: ATP synthase F0 subunit C [Myxococcota bacterium]|nr:ATP synthase F0 subunit C [Myxococcota bacterium]
MSKLTRFLVPATTFLVMILLPAIVLAADGITASPAGKELAEGAGWVAVGAGVAIGFAALGCGIGQGLAALGALQGISRNPSASGKIQTPMLICLALIESLCIYALVIAFFLQGKF